MSATRVFHPLSASNLHISPLLSGRALILVHFLPAIFLTLLGVAALSMYWAAFVLATPGTLSIVVSVLVQLAWLISLVDVWLQNTYSVFRREPAALGGIHLRSHVRP
jgi:hypothetical protein